MSLRTRLAKDIASKDFEFGDRARRLSAVFRSYEKDGRFVTGERVSVRSDFLRLWLGQIILIANSTRQVEILGPGDTVAFLLRKSPDVLQ